MVKSPSRSDSPSGPVSAADPCPCGSGAAFGACCGPVIAGSAPAPTAEALMRSRFTAFVVDDMPYIARSWASETRPPLDGNGEVIEEGAGEIGAAEVEWTALEILETVGGAAGDETGTVTFAAEGRHMGRAFLHRETSHFRREDGRWVYLDGDIAPPEAVAQVPVRVTKIGRNEPCPCGSGKKYKKCCGA